MQNIKVKTLCTILVGLTLILLACSPQKEMIGDDLDWILNCGAIEYYNRIDNLGRSDSRKNDVLEVLRFQLPTFSFSQNTECVFDVILAYGDSTITDIFRSRFESSSENPDLGQDSYCRDLYLLLETRGNHFSSEEEFRYTVQNLKHSVSVEHFLDIHIEDLSMVSQLNILLFLTQNIFPTDATFPYYAISILGSLYVSDPIGYVEYVKGLENAPSEFICVMDNTCP